MDSDGWRETANGFTSPRGAMDILGGMSRLLASLLLFVVSSQAGAALIDRLQKLAPELRPQVLQQALHARECALAGGMVTDPARLGVIDYSLPSTEPRLWVFDLGQQRLLFREYVAHGRDSGGNLASQFSNREGSHQSSLGLFRTAETYQGAHGYSLRLDGLQPGLNDHARERAIVMHGADYVDPQLARLQGRLGRSLGCPAVRPRVAKALIDTLKQGQLLYAAGPISPLPTISHCGGLASAWP